MKIRAGFVSNSSSTSFLIIAKEDLNERDFFELMGIARNSPVADLFKQFYADVVESARTKVDFRTVPEHVPIEALFANARGDLSPHMLKRLKDARKKGLKAYFGWLDSETNSVQTFFCTDSFEVENEKIYFNGLECVW
jgi:hypothetical protein